MGGDGEREREREKQTEAGVNYGCNLRFPREGGGAGRNIKSCISDCAFATFSLAWTASRLHIQSGFSALCVCACRRESIYTFIRVESRGCRPCCQASTELDTPPRVFTVQLSRDLRRLASRISITAAFTHLALCLQPPVNKARF